MVLMASNQSPEVFKTGKQVFYFPPAPIITYFSLVITSCFSQIFAVQGYNDYAFFIQKPYIKSIAILNPIANNSIRIMRRIAAAECQLYHPYFMARCAFNVGKGSETFSVSDCCDLGAFFVLWLPDREILFLVGPYFTAMITSRISILTHSSNFCSRSLFIRLKTPNSTHCCTRFCQVWYGRYRICKFFNGTTFKKNITSHLKHCNEPVLYVLNYLYSFSLIKLRDLSDSIFHL